MAATGVMQFWPAVVTASLDQAPLLLHQAGTHLLQPLPLVTLVISAVLVLLAGRRLSTGIAAVSPVTRDPWPLPS